MALSLLYHHIRYSSCNKQVERRYEESKDRANHIGAEAVDKAQSCADTESSQESEEKKMGMREKMSQMGVSPIFVLFPRKYLPIAL